MIFTKTQLINELALNSKVQKNAKYSNDVIIQMLLTLNDNFTANLECTRGGFPFNRGSLVECIIKAVVLDTLEGVKSECNKSDLDTTKLNAKQLELVNGVKSSNIEVKFSTSFAPATHKHNKAHYTIIACAYGIFMIQSKNIVWTKAGKLNINNQRASDLIPLRALEERLGY